MKLKERAKQLKFDIPAIFIVLRKKETPVLTKLLAGITILYALSPIDLIPDFIPILGYLDDLIILPFLITLTLRLIPKDLLTECRNQAEGLWENGKPKKWYYALPIICFWLLIIFIIVSIIW